MTALFSKFGFPELMGFFVVGGGLLMGFFTITAAFWTDIRKKEISAALKQDMLNRGMSAQEIRMVLDAGTKRSVTEVPGLWKSSTEVA